MKTVFRQIGFVAVAVAVILTTIGLQPKAAYAAGNFELFTPYRELTAAPGESLTYSIDLINHTSTTQLADLNLRTNNDWIYDLTVGGKHVQQVAVKSGESQAMNMRLDVPLQVEKGAYSFTIGAGDASLELVVNVAEKGSFQSNFEIEQANMEGYAGGKFTFSSTLRNQTADAQTYALAANPPAGWEVRFQSSSNYVSSISLEPNESQSINVEVTAPENVEAGNYNIKLAAYNNATQAETEIDVTIIGSYAITLKTSDERLNTSIRAGQERTLEFIVENTGTAELQAINLSSIAPTNWQVQFEPKTIEKLEPGKTVAVQAVVTSSEDALPGDYVMNVTASTDQKSASSSIRVTVKSSVLWGWVGVAIIALVIGLVYILFRRYGRR